MESSELGRWERWEVSELGRWGKREGRAVARSKRWEGSEVASRERWMSSEVARWERWVSSEEARLEIPGFIQGWRRRVRPKFHLFVSDVNQQNEGVWIQDILASPQG